MHGLLCPGQIVNKIDKIRFNFFLLVNESNKNVLKSTPRYIFGNKNDRPQLALNNSAELVL